MHVWSDPSPNLISEERSQSEGSRITGDKLVSLRAKILDSWNCSQHMQRGERVDSRQFGVRFQSSLEV